VKEKTALSANTLALAALDWWCPDRTRTFTDDVTELTAYFTDALAALDIKDWSTYNVVIQRAAAGTLGYDTVREEDELLAYLDDLCRGYHD
jgi:hypothetical protein